MPSNVSRTPITKRAVAPLKRPTSRSSLTRTTPKTLAFDIGGTGLKASLVTTTGDLIGDKERILTPYPLTPELLIEKLGELKSKLPAAQRISAGFPGMVRDGIILTAPHFVLEKGPGVKPERPSKRLLLAWDHFDLRTQIETAFRLKTLVANDADIAGAGVIEGKGLELVITLGTGFGTGLFLNGKLLPHLEIAHMPIKGKLTFDDYLGDHSRKELGNREWSKRVIHGINLLTTLFSFDHLYIGGGNSRRLKIETDDKTTIVGNEAGLIGGVKLWERV